MESECFKITFRGVRGSIPSPMMGEEIAQKLKKALEMAKPEDLSSLESIDNFVQSLPDHLKGCYGGNTSCIQVELGGQNIIFDAGSGLRVLGNEMMQAEFGEGEGVAHIFLSHTHWDHINGIPFFSPFYVKGNKFFLYSLHKDFKRRLVGQQNFEYFPVAFHKQGADIEFVDLNDISQHEICDSVITWREMEHPGKSYSFKLDYKGKSIIYATDVEYKNLSKESLSPIVEFFKDADLLIFDSQYTFVEGVEKEDWGHSSTFIGVDLALEAGVKQIAFFHHEPTYDDFKLVSIFEKTRKYLNTIAPNSSLDMFLAREGLAINMLAD
jgi:phosphoribosyl 1,2-cyclic phosphodiesterase